MQGSYNNTSFLIEGTEKSINSSQIRLRSYFTDSPESSRGQRAEGRAQWEVDVRSVVQSSRFACMQQALPLLASLLNGVAMSLLQAIIQFSVSLMGPGRARRGSCMHSVGNHVIVIVRSHESTTSQYPLQPRVVWRTHDLVAINQKIVPRSSTGRRCILKFLPLAGETLFWS